MSQQKCYEEYESTKEKRQATKNGCKRSKPTGKARGYLLTDGNGSTSSAQGSMFGVVSSVFDVAPGGPPVSLCFCTASLNYIRDNCRLVGRCHLPPEWKKAFDRYEEKGQL